MEEGRLSMFLLSYSDSVLVTATLIVPISCAAHTGKKKGRGGLYCLGEGSVVGARGDDSDIALDAPAEEGG
jgi:hypothetical protein